MKNILSSLNSDTSDSENDDLMLFLMSSMDKYDNGYKPVSELVIYCYKTAEKMHRQLIVCCEHVQEKSRDSFISIDVPICQQRFNNPYKEFFVLDSDEISWW